MLDRLKSPRLHNELRLILMTLGLVAAVTLVIYAAVAQIGLEHGSVVYLVPVLIAGTRWGVAPAIVAAVCGVLASPARRSRSSSR